jgi:hypothetical protein
VFARLRRAAGILDTSTLRGLLTDPECPYTRSANDIPAALREGRPPARTGWIDQGALIGFIAERTGEEPSRALIDELMVGELGAKRVRVRRLDGRLRRVARALAGRPEPGPVTYEVSDLP